MLKDKAMLVGLTIRAWVARKYDREISTEVSCQHGAVPDAGRFNKHLLPGNAESYEAVLKKGRELRAFYYENTLPWSKEGHRILPSANYTQFADGVRKYQRELDLLTASFLAEYPRLREEAKILLNGMYRESDYPMLEEMRGKFGVEVEILPLPDADDFRVSIQQDEIQKIQKELEERVAREFHAANRDLWNRLRIAVDNMVNRLSDPQAVFRDSLVTNLRELVDIIPRLNVTGDKDLAEVTRVCAEALTRHEPQTLRDDPQIRSEVAMRAREIARVMDAFI